MTRWRSRASSTGRMYRAHMPDGREVAVKVGPRRGGRAVATVNRPAERGSLTAGLSFGAASFLGTTMVTLFTSVFIARLYGVNVVGRFALVYAPVAAVSLLSTVREQPALQREVALLPPRHPRATGLFMAVFAFSSALTVVVAAIGVLITYFLFRGPINHPALFMPALVSMAGYTVFTNTCMNLDSIFVAYRDGRQLFVLRLHQAVLYLVLVVAVPIRLRLGVVARVHDDHLLGDPVPAPRDRTAALVDAQDFARRGAQWVRRASADAQVWVEADPDRAPVGRQRPDRYLGVGVGFHGGRRRCLQPGLVARPALPRGAPAPQRVALPHLGGAPAGARHRRASTVR